ncbi:UDP-glucose flavonoid 3-O-glucosyltransferase 3-like protein [Trifolium pratense]|uniref:UDP-glucose flavonoid 3-O-glucosyltransferase 3-like protein n=1 Tax=Trifolium pratense TaxID=57577 RepID=A0A2K3MLZ4_TRIPR|nr:UDP-glucose flavonoid 3-O-glucosyltransferase 3-like protein [Trifolium pratense]
MMKKAEVVIIPSPGVGHLVSTLEFAKLLINRNNHLRITILVIKLPHTTETDIYTKSLSNSNSLNIINLPECSLPTNSNLGSAMNAILEAQKQNVKQAVADLITEREDGVLAAFVVDLLTCSALTLLMLLENSPSLRLCSSLPVLLFLV